MSAERAKLTRWADVPKETLTPMLARQVITGDRMMLARLYLEEGALVPKHSHENEQLTYVLEGRLRFTLGEEQRCWTSRCLQRCSVLVSCVRGRCIGLR